MKKWLYKNWAKLCIILSIIVTIISLLYVKTDNIILFLIWIQIPIYLLHQFEEHSWPGGFKRFVNKEIFNVENGEYPLNDIIIFWINVPIIWILMPIFAVLSFNNLLFGLWIPIFAVFNSLTHVIGVIVKRKYNPGLFVSVVLGIPVAIYTLWLFYTLINIPLMVTLLSIVVVLLLHLAIIIPAVRRSKINKG
ncbi:HXXEE domain-containing protein [Methanobacterium spitsbergense]|uniref:HXXEE domain-containing protein n=1 Tax=Methanobacterium spitsbergense TaxID=2874285 RepID=A0A8T5V0E9_9EURY|nr:HXXEE domain-containing protein [Methanobacterium spitsbergense]MBZ2166459.1 HXXEE domain-containing protein [Methanobacterium spitsbergense]